MSEKLTVQEMEDALVQYFEAAGQGNTYIQHLIKNSPELATLSYEEAIARIYEAEVQGK